MIVSSRSAPVEIMSIGTPASFSMRRRYWRALAGKAPKSLTPAVDSFQPGTNMSAWMFTILRNLFRSEYRKRRREVEDTDGSYAESLKSHPEQNSHLEFKEFKSALAKLPQDQREALILVGASGFSYEEAAAICECAVGTIKSRVNRARSKLAALLYVDGAEDFGPDETVRAVIGGSGG